MDTLLTDRKTSSVSLPQEENSRSHTATFEHVAMSEMRYADFSSVAEALDYASQGSNGYHFYNAKAELDIVLSYKELRAQARELAKCLRGAGLQRNDRVGIIADMTPDFVVGFYACQYAGLLAVPLPVVTGLGGRHGYEEQLRNILEVSEARIAFGTGGALEYLQAASEGLAVKLVTTVDSFVETERAKDELEPYRAGEASHIQFSSGSTRYPSGILIMQDALMANARSVGQDALMFEGPERVASWLPFYHDMGLIGCMIMPLTFQFNVDYIHTDAFARRPLQWLQIISENKCTIAFSPSFGYEICTRRAQGKKDLELDLSSWRVAGIGGEMVQANVLQDFANAFSSYGFKDSSFVPSYGLAEATLAFSFVPPGQGVRVDSVDKNVLTKEGRAEPCERNSENVSVRNFAASGYPMPGYKVEIRNDDGAVLSDREVGRVFIKGPSLMAGYFKDRAATANIFDMKGWMDTGDMGYVSEHMLYITGRQKDLIIINGKNIWPQDLEWHAEGGVEELRPRDTAAFTMERDDGKEKAVILVQCRSKDEATREALKKKVHSVIMKGTAVDCEVVLIPQRCLPYTTSGKLSRAKAKQSYINGDYDM